MDERQIISICHENFKFTIRISKYRVYRIENGKSLKYEASFIIMKSGENIVLNSLILSKLFSINTRHLINI